MCKPQNISSADNFFPKKYLSIRYERFVLCTPAHVSAAAAPVRGAAVFPTQVLQKSARNLQRLLQASTQHIYEALSTQCRCDLSHRGSVRSLGKSPTLLQEAPRGAGRAARCGSQRSQPRLLRPNRLRCLHDASSQSRSGRASGCGAALPAERHVLSADGEPPGRSIAGPPAMQPAAAHGTPGQTAPPRLCRAYAHPV